MGIRAEMAKYKSLMVKSNYIIEASYRLSLQEQRIIYMLTTEINQDDVEFKIYRFHVKEIAKAIGTKHKNMYSEISRHIEHLRNKDLTIIKEKSILKTKWLSSAEYFTEEGVIELCFDPKLKPYLLQLKGRFTKIDLGNVVSLSSVYACRVYELLKQYRNIGERTLSIDDIRTMFCIDADVYTRYNDFKRKVILQAQKEINKNSDIWFDFEEIKAGRKITKLRFIIKPNKSNVQKHEEESNNKTDKEYNGIKQIKSIIQEPISDIEASKILSVANGDIGKIKEKYNIISQFERVNNTVGAIITALKEDWKVIEKSKVSIFNNFEQRTYNFDELENKLLGWD